MDGEDHQEEESFADWVEYVKLLKKFMLEGLFPSGTSKKEKDKIRKAAQSGNYRIQGMTLFYTLKKGRVEKECQVIETQQERDKVIFANHSTPAAGHFAPRNTLKKISAIYYWKRMKEDITQYCKYCESCQKYEKIKTQPPVLHSIKVQEPWEQSGMDLIGPYPETSSGNKWILTLTDYFTKWVAAYAIPSKTAGAVIQALDTFLTMFGPPKKSITDNGGEFTAEVSDAFLALWRIHHLLTAPEHPQTNGLDERTNQTFKIQLNKVCHDNPDMEWDKLVPHVAYAINTKEQAAIKFSPYFSIYGHHPYSRCLPDAAAETASTAPVEDEDLEAHVARRVEVARKTHALIRENQQAAQIRDQRRFAQKKLKGFQSFEFVVGDKVCYRDQTSRRRFRNKEPWHGPVIVTKVEGSQFVWLQDGDKKLFKRPYADCKLFREKKTVPPPLPALPDPCESAQDLVADLPSPLGLPEKEDVTPEPVTPEMPVSSSAASGVPKYTVSRDAAGNLKLIQLTGSMVDGHHQGGQIRILAPPSEAQGNTNITPAPIPANGVKPTKIMVIRRTKNITASVAQAPASPARPPQAPPAAARPPPMGPSAPRPPPAPPSTACPPQAPLMGTSAPRPPQAPPSAARPPPMKPSAPRPPPAPPSTARPPQAPQTRPSAPRPPQAPPSTARPPPMGPSAPRPPQAPPAAARPPHAPPAAARPPPMGPSAPRPPQAPPAAARPPQAPTAAARPPHAPPAAARPPPMGPSAPRPPQAPPSTARPPPMGPSAPRPPQAPPAAARPPHAPPAAARPPPMGPSAPHPPQAPPAAARPTQAPPAAPRPQQDSAFTGRAQQKGLSTPPHPKAPPSSKRPAGSDGPTQQPNKRRKEDAGPLGKRAQTRVDAMKERKFLEEIESPNRWLDDIHMNRAQKMLKLQHPHIQGFKDVLTLQTRVEPGIGNNFVQIVNLYGNHWVTVTDIGAAPNRIHVYDCSYNKPVSKTEVETLIAALLRTERSYVGYKFPKMQKQKGSDDCGLFAVAVAEQLCRGAEPAQFTFDQQKMRRHLGDCVRRGLITPFPGQPNSTDVEFTYADCFNVHCQCRMPGRGKTVECDRCNEWYHHRCVKLPRGFKSGDYWMCATCRQTG